MDISDYEGAQVIHDLNFTIPEHLEKKYDVPAEMIVRLIQVETSMDGLSRRSGITKKLKTILSQDWVIDEAFATRRDQAQSHMGFAERLSEVEVEASEVNRELNKLSS